MFPDKVIQCDCEGEKHSITFRSEQVENEKPAYKFTASLEDVSHEYTLTMGAVDGPLIQPTLEQFQRDVDSARQLAADHCHAKHLLEQFKKEIQ